MDNNDPTFLEQQGEHDTQPSTEDELLSFEDLIDDSGAPSRLRIVLIGGGIVVGLLILWWIISMIMSGGKTTTVTPATIPDTTPEFATTVNTGGSVDAVEAGASRSTPIDTSIAIGLADNKPLLSGVESAHISALRELRNLLLVNIVSLAKESTDRPATLKNYDTSLRNISKKVVEIRDKLQLEHTLVASELTRINSEKEAQKSRYETSLQQYDGNIAIDELKGFIASQKYASELFTQSKHIESIISLCNSLLGVSARKITFLTANKEALLYDIGVVDISGLEEDLIQTEEEWRNSL